LFTELSEELCVYRGRRGRKSDFPDAARELTLNFVPDAEQRLWHGDAEKVPIDVRSRASAEPIGVPSGRGPQQVVLCDALGARTDLKSVYRRPLKMALEHSCNSLSQQNFKFNKYKYCDSANRQNSCRL
jgi:hypothetical protein